MINEYENALKMNKLLNILQQNQKHRLRGAAYKLCSILLSHIEFGFGEQRCMKFSLTGFLLKIEFFQCTSIRRLIETQ